MLITIIPLFYFRCHQQSEEKLVHLRELWEAGLNSVGDKKKLCEVVEATGLAEKTIKVCWDS